MFKFPERPEKDEGKTVILSLFPPFHSKLKIFSIWQPHWKTEQPNFKPTIKQQNNDFL